MGHNRYTCHGTIDMPSSLGTALADVRSRLGQSQNALAEQLGVRQATVSMRERGAVGLTITELERFVAKTGHALVLTPEGWDPVELPRPDLLPRIPDEWPEQMASVLGGAAAGVGVLNDQLAEREVWALADWLERIDGLVRVKGNSMEPLLKDGDLVGVQPEVEPRVGDVVVVEYPEQEGEIVVKLWAGYSPDGRWAGLTGLNPPGIFIHCRPEAIRVRGKALGLFRDGAFRVPDRTA